MAGPLQLADSPGRWQKQTMKPLAIAILAAALFVDSAAYAADPNLIGRWNAVDQPGKWAEFYPDGSFEYAYELLGTIPAVLSVRWTTGWFNSLTLTNGSNSRSCHYKLEGNDLFLYSSLRKSCIEQLNMALHFRRAP
jgi:hypothetical protein